MTTETLTLTDFLLARITEDEETARAATAGPWEWQAYPYSDGSAEHELQSISAHPVTVVSAHGMHTEGYVDCEPADRDHIARWHPARVLAECEAKRRIVEGFKFEDSDESAIDAWMAEDLTPPAAIKNLIYVAKCLALPYADHPDYREEWRP